MKSGAWLVLAAVLGARAWAGDDAMSVGPTVPVMRFDGQGGPEDPSMIKLSPGAKHVACWSRVMRPDPKGNACVVRLDDKVVGEWRDMYNFFFSPDGEHLGFLASDGQKWKLVVDGTERGDSLIILGDPVLGNGGHIAGVVSRRVPAGEELAWLADGETMAVRVDGTWVFAGDAAKRKWRDLGRPTFSVDGATLAFPAWTDGKDSCASIVVAGTETARFPVDAANLPGDGAFSCSQDLKHLFWSVNGSDGGRLFRDGKDWLRGAPDGLGLLLSPDASRAICWNGKSGPPGAAWIDGERVPLDTIGRVEAAFSADGKHSAFCTSSNNTTNALVDGKPLGPYTYIGHPCWSPDGNHFACMTSGGLSIDGTMVTGHGGKDIGFSAEGKLVMIDFKPLPRPSTVTRTEGTFAN